MIYHHSTSPRPHGFVKHYALPAVLGFATTAYLIVGFDQTVKGEEVAHAPSAAGIIMLSTGTATATLLSDAGFYNFLPVTKLDAEHLVPPAPERATIRDDRVTVLSSSGGAGPTERIGRYGVDQDRCRTG
jgi:hypothetical protein